MLRRLIPVPNIRRDFCGARSYACRVETRLNASPLARTIALVLLSLPLNAALLPDQIGESTKSSTSALPAPDRSLYTEYGLQSSEQATYADPAFTVKAWRLRDSTGAFALYQHLRPPASQPNDIVELSSTAKDTLLAAYGNYVLEFTNKIPTKAELNTLVNRLPELENSSLPTLTGFLPKEDLIPNSERYILGPVSLERFLPGIPPSIAAFSLGTEAQLGRYNTSKGEMTLALFNYPAPAMARERQDQFLKLPNTVAKRSGPLVAVIVQAPDPDAAERLLGKVVYETTITWADPPGDGDKGLTWGGLITGSFVLAAVIGVVSLLAGLGLGGFRSLSRKLGWSSEPDAITVLRINEPRSAPKEPFKPRP